MARVSIKSICDELMAEFKTMRFIQKRLLKKLGKEVDDSAIRAQANRLVREGEIDHARAAKKYNIRGPKVDGTETPPKRKAKVSKVAKVEEPAKKAKAEKPSKKKSEKVSKLSAKKSKQGGDSSKKVKTRRRLKG